MKLEALSRLITSADFLSFREIALRTLSLKGYREPSLTDGWKDGGTDIRVIQIPPNPTSLAIQISVERNWRSKLKADARKVKEKLNLVDLLFITSRRVPEAELVEVADEIWREYGVRTSKIDNQTIASTFFEQGRTTEILTILGMDLTITHHSFGDAADSARLDAAYSFVFFGKEPEQFRERMVESAIITTAAKYDATVTRDVLAEEAQKTLQLPKRQKQLISGSIDRMLQRGDLLGNPARISLSPKIKDAALALRVVREKEWDLLRDDVKSTLVKSSSQKDISDEIIDSMMEDIGGLLMATAETNFYALNRSVKRGVALERIRQRLQHLHTTLDSMTFPEGEVRTETLEKLAELASNSPIGRHFLAGELFLSLSAVNTPYLVRAFGAQSNIRVCLDASVAIPILSSLLYEAASTHRYFLAALHAYEQLSDLGIELQIPADYLEEVAAHLLMAYRDYSAVADLDPDLIASENAFVAHYVSLKSKRDNIPFEKYLATYGLDERLKKLELRAAVPLLIPRIARLFARYGIKEADMRFRNYNSKKQVEEMIARAIHALSLNRPQIVLEHDIRVLAALMEQNQFANEAMILCTWDSLHFWILQKESPNWDVLDPAVLGDILSLINPDNDDAMITSPLVLAKSLSEEVAHIGAAIWDDLVRIEHENLYDADLLAKAQAFKRTFMAQKQQGLSTGDIAQEWIKWKTQEESSS